MADTYGMWAWHVHHESLVERLSSGGLEGRQDYINRSKSSAERPLRLKLLRLVKDQNRLTKIFDRVHMGGSMKAFDRALKALHAEECFKSCPWKPDYPEDFSNGTIFSPGWRLNRLAQKPKARTAKAK